MSYTPPSPTPPWSRPVRTPAKQVIFEDDTISLESDTTYFEKEIGDPSAPLSVVMPDGNYLGQNKKLLITEDKRPTTETINISGNFAGINSLTLNTIGFNAVLEWDGAAWHLLAGNAVANVE